MKKNIYILHGWAYELRKWQPFVDALQDTGYQIKLLKIPGLTGPEPSKAWTINDYVDWFDRQLEVNEPVIIIGHSNGGRIALNFSIKHPKKVEKLILIDSAGIPPKGIKSSIKRNILKIAAKTGKSITKSPKARQLLYKIARKKDYYNASIIMRQTMINLTTSDKSLDLTKVSVPLSLIWGRDDQMTPLSNAIEMKKAVAGSNLTIIDDARHAPQFTKLAEVIKAVKASI